MRVLWEVIASASVGAVIAKLAGGNLGVGAVGGGVSQVARSLPPLVREFGPALFGRGAFDLARRVQRGVANIEIDALPSLISDAEKQQLGLS
jgi:hypothetical protein